MIRALKVLFCIGVIAVWLFIAYIVIELIGQQLEFSRSMGGLW